MESSQQNILDHGWLHVASLKFDQEVLEILLVKLSDNLVHQTLSVSSSHNRPNSSNSSSSVLEAKLENFVSLKISLLDILSIVHVIKGNHKWNLELLGMDILNNPGSKSFLIRG